jgi:hypothetical protein
VAEASATAWWGFRRQRVESGGCHSVGNLHRVTDSVGVISTGRVALCSACARS